MKLQIKSIIWNIKKQKQPIRTRGKMNPKNKGSISSLWDNFKKSNIYIIRVPKEKKKCKKLGIYLKK